PLDQSFLLCRQIDHMRARSGVVAGDGILPIWFPRADGFKEVAKVSERRLRTFIFEMLRRRSRPTLDLAGDHFRITEIGVLERLRPTLDDPAIIFVDVLRIQTDACSRDRERSLGPQNLKSGFGRELIIER